MTLHDDGMRTIVEVPDDVVESLDEIGEAGGFRAALIRYAISDFLNKSEGSRSEAFGLWKDRSEDGVAY